MTGNVRTDDQRAFARLGTLFDPQSIAVIGASDDPNKIGGRPLRYLAQSGYAGRIHPVNPRYDSVQGQRAWGTVTAIDEPVDLALIAVPGSAVPGAIDDCIAAGVATAVVFSSGFAEVGAEGRRKQEELVATARAGGVRILGPNSLGAASSSNGLVASFATLFDRHPQMRSGRVGFVSQSGALGVFIYALAQDQGLGFSRFVSIGNEADLDVADVLSFFAHDEETIAVGGYLESVKDGRRFLAAADQVRQAGKPMSFLKVGRSEAGQRAAESHTGALAGTDAVYDAALRQAGIVRATDPQGLIDFLAFHAQGERPPAQEGVGVLTISGGAGVWTADRLADLDVELADLAPETVTRLANALPSFATPQNPVDATGQILNDPALFDTCLGALLDDPNVATLIVILGLQERGGAALADQIVRAGRKHPDRTIAVAWLAAPDGLPERLGAAGVPVFGDLARCVEAVAGSVRAGRVSRAPATAIGERPIPVATPAVEEHDGDLTEHAAKRLIADLGVAVPAGALCRTSAEAEAAAETYGWPVVLKGQVRGMAHKTEHQLVRLGLSSIAEVQEAYDELAATFATICDPADVEGVLVEAMAPDGVEVIAGCISDPVFGSTVMFGLGGILVEVMEDVAFRIAPIDEEEALAMIDQTRGAQILNGVRGGPPLDKRAVARVLATISALAASDSRVREIEINPLRVYPDGALALDALILRDSGPVAAPAAGR